MKKITRTVGEAILIDGDIQVTLLSINGRRARFGIVGPDYKLGGLGEAAREGNAREPGPVISGRCFGKD